MSPPSTIYRWTTGWDSDMHQGRKDNMFMDIKNLQQFNTDGISANDHLGYEERMHRWTQRPAEEAVSWKRR
jgi:hypothetical protein